jgi:hypothetical protein
MRARPGATTPFSTTWLAVSRSGFSSTGFMPVCGATRAASAWKYCAEPISPRRPSGRGTTRALLLMFCAL